ncbi:EAL domain-containing protein [Roseisolibacter sp. H3M3-2]|uniref:EAL domain-containing protein n=1 Tax=Roseisolibacter sp. H3M3-2 TaxID=3031323 RepID=UPI0023DB8F23|nr:EAL domain-containing protein [Roseisolibacter sp. H3M3-2]MDF1504201.1 EAL domain-containing protein [Roseisolibacter sp. H3M3-2]
MTPPARVPCATCEVLPVLPRGAGRLHLWLPSAHGVAKTTAAARRLGLAPRAGAAHGVSVDVGDEALPDVAAALADALTALERDDTRVLFTPGGAEPSAADVSRVASLARFQALLDSAWLVEVMERQRLTSHFQPIALGDDPTRVVGHEALLRGVDADGALLPPVRLFDAARRAGLLFPLDLAARRTHIAGAAAAGLDGLLFLNFTPTAIYDPAMCLRSTVAAIDAAGIAHERIVFEVVESEGIADTDHLRAILDYYRRAGFRVALDDVGAGYSSLNRLHLLRPDLLKLDLQLVRDVHADPYKAVVAEKVLELADSLAIPVLAEGVETAEELAWLQARGIRYVQGWHVGRPAAAPRPVARLAAADALRARRGEGALAGA